MSKQASTIMSMQDFINIMNEMTAKERSHYHLTYGDLIDALEVAPADAEFDPRVKGIGSWRGSTTEALRIPERVRFAHVWYTYMCK